MGRTLVPGGVTAPVNHRLPISHMDLRLTRKTNHLMSNAILNTERILSILKQGHSKDSPLHSDLNELLFLVHEVFFLGAAPKNLGSVSAQVELFAEGVSSEQLKSLDNPRAILREIEGVMELRDPRENLLFRHMDGLLDLIHPTAITGPLGRSFILSFDRFCGRASLSRKEQAMLRELFARREGFLKRSDEESFRAYDEIVNQLGARLRLDREALAELTDELLVELQWLKST